MSGARVVVTGGAGFLGSHLADALIARGAQVVAIDNFVTGSKDNVAHLEDHPRFVLVEVYRTPQAPAEAIVNCKAPQKSRLT